MPSKTIECGDETVEVTVEDGEAHAEVRRDIERYLDNHPQVVDFHRKMMGREGDEYSIGLDTSSAHGLVNAELPDGWEIFRVEGDRTFDTDEGAYVRIRRDD